MKPLSKEIQAITDFDRLIHEPSRLAIMAVLSAAYNADFKFVLNATGLSKGNLSVHMRKLEDGGYLKITKGFKGNYPHTTLTLTKEGRKAFKAYQKQYLTLAKQFEGGG